MIVVTGATGSLGRSIAEKLLEKLPADQLGVSVRDPGKASALAERGVRVRRGDFADVASLQSAFESASRVLIVSNDSLGEQAIQLHRNAIAAAKAAGVQRIVYTSHMGAGARSLFRPMVDHAATEALLQESGVAFTALRNGFYQSSALLFMGRALETGKLVAPEDGPVSWTAHADLADAACIALTDDQRLNGITPPLTAAEALDLTAIAALATEITGREITRITVPAQHYRAELISHGVPADRADLLLTIFAASKNREFAAVDPTLTALLSRPPITLRETLKRASTAQSAPRR